jgi:hypothetical protein
LFGGAGKKVAVLYTPFREVLRRYARAARAFAGHTLPDHLEVPSPPHAAMLELEAGTRYRVRELLRHFPEVPPGGFGESDPAFGPVVHPDDMRVTASVLLPLALALGDDFPTESYGPIGFLREKCVLLTSAIEVSAGWRAYTVGKYPTRWRGFPAQVPPGVPAGVVLVSPEELHLARLFDNLTASAARCRQAVGFQSGCSADTL